MEVCKTDMQKIIKYLNDAAIMYDNHPGQRNVLKIVVCHERYYNAKQTTIRLLRMQLLSCREASYGFCPYFEMWTYFFGKHSYLCVSRYDS